MIQTQARNFGRTLKIEGQVVPKEDLSIRMTLLKRFGTNLMTSLTSMKTRSQQEIPLVMRQKEQITRRI